MPVHVKHGPGGTKVVGVDFSRPATKEEAYAAAALVERYNAWAEQVRRQARGRASARQRSLKATEARQQSKLRNDEVILRAIADYVKQHPEAKKHKIATQVARKLELSVSAVKNRLK